MPPFVATTVQFATPGTAAPLVGTLLAPTPPSLPHATPVALLCHGLADHRDTRLLKSLATGLEAAGVASLRFDFGGNCDSVCARPFRFGNVRAEGFDVRAAAAAVTAWGGRVIAACGHSKGASSVLLAAAGVGAPPECADTPPLASPSIVNIAGRFDHSVLKERFGESVLASLAAAGDAGVPIVWRLGASSTPTEWRLTAADVDDRLTTDMAAACARVPASTRVLHVHGSRDATVPPAAAAAFAEATAHCATCDLSYIEGGDHNFTDDAHLAQLVERVVAFVVAGL